MEKRIAILLAMCMLIGLSAWAQDEQKRETSYDQFTSQSGKIIRFQDYKLASMKGTFAPYACRVRVIKAGDVTTYYFQVIISGKYSDIVGSIEDGDLDEMAKALISLQNSFSQDKVGNSDYLENKYITNDGVKLGYYVSGKESSWYFNLDQYKSDSTAFFKDAEPIALALKAAQDKIAQLKQ